MSHTEFHGKTTFIFNGGYDGNVKIIANEMTVEFPMSALLGFMANYLRKERINKIELATDKEIFGLNP